MHPKIVEVWNKLAILPTNELETDYMAMYLFEEEEQKDAQISYESKAEGQWQESWFLIGEEGDTDDPIFVDFSQEGLPVYTVMADEEKWEAILIFKSLDILIQEMTK